MAEEGFDDFEMQDLGRKYPQYDDMNDEQLNDEYDNNFVGIVILTDLIMSKREWIVLIVPVKIKDLMMSHHLYTVTMVKL